MEIAFFAYAVLATFSSRTVGELYISSFQALVTHEVTQAAFHLRPFVTSPADHFPHSLCIHCPCQWHDLLIRTFLDANVFTPCKATPVQTVQQIRNSVPEWILRHYAWGLDFSAKLSTGYILPKPSRMFKKARPIINYSTS